MYEVLDDTAAQVILAIEGGDSIRRVAQRLHTPYETVRQAVNRLEDAEGQPHRQHLETDQIEQMIQLHYILQNIGDTTSSTVAPID